jgi:hypothetical protein
MLDNNGYIRSTTEPILPVGQPQIEKKIRVYGLAITIKWLAAIDIIIAIYYTWTAAWACIFLTFLYWCGYYGAKKYKPNYILGYLGCIVGYSILKIIILYYSHYPIVFVFNLVSLLFELYFFFVVKNFYNDLKELSNECLEELRNPDFEPESISMIYY